MLSLYRGGLAVVYASIIYLVIRRVLSCFVPPDPALRLPYDFATSHAVQVKVLIIPADGRTPFTKVLSTIDVSKAGNADRQLYHVPDMQYSWNTAKGWLYRDLLRFDVKNHENEKLNGCYYGFKSFAVDHLKRNKHAKWGIWGDACIAKMSEERFMARGIRVIKIGKEEKEYKDYNLVYPRYAVYEDVDEALVGTGLWKDILEELKGI
ncbi:hypothetical protein LOCC1_G007986 [Lachnellula occidentalis]|uniref:Uncharacterized protein n=1 Tax=Lachnellula occidentalis TaxID=215460 RepID=A0A8H8U6S1_9HELO|nr:hypothetical protein LOCC1_G007986 [Lachnellula occidentalis]